jgi:signal transduction histidine kinase
MLEIHEILSTDVKEKLTNHPLDNVQSKLRKETVVQTALLLASRLICSPLKLDRVLSIISELMVDVLDSTSAYISSYEPDTNSSIVLAENYSQFATSEERVSDLGVRHILSEEFPEDVEALRIGNPTVYHVSDINIAESQRNAMLRKGVKSVLTIPLQVRGETTAFAEIGESRYQREFTSDEISLAQGIALHAAIAIETTRNHKELLRYASELESCNQELERFAYVTSHDLKEPLRMVSVYTELLAERYMGELGEDADEFITYAVEGAKRMYDLIDALLSYSRTDTESARIELVDSVEVVQFVLEKLQYPLEESQAEVVLGKLPFVMADRDQLIQLFQHLIGNAIKFRGRDPPYLKIDVRRQNEMWIFSVQDNGIGIDPEHTDQIFLLFERLNTQDQYPGVGIGLTVCKKIVERHGGRIWVESQFGQGSTFYFTLPIRRGGHHD